MSLRDAPPHFEILSEDDKQMYARICAAVQAPSLRNKRNKRADDFRDVLEAIELFENHDIEGKWKRCLVCGLFKFENGIAVNISVLKRLIMKCKSSINGSLKAIGYPTVSYKAANCEELLNGIPFLKGNVPELRQWTIRYTSTESKPNISDEYVTPPSLPIEEKAKTFFTVTLDGSNPSNDEFSFDFLDFIDSSEI